MKKIFWGFVFSIMLSFFLLPSTVLADANMNPKDWKVEYGSSKTVTVSGYAGNQESGGKRFKTGGGFYYSDSGGPSVSFSVSFPWPLDIASGSIGLGKSGSSGVFVSVPSKKYFYKLYITKKVKVTPHITYKREKNSKGKYVWKKWSSGHNSVVTSTTYEAKKVK